MASNKRINKAYVRYDGSGRVISGSLILNRFKPKVGNWSEIPAYECCNSAPVSLPLRLLFYDIEFAIARVGDINNIANWNTYFDLPTLGGAFTSVEVNGNEVKLYGGSNIKIKPALMYDEGSDIIELDDQAGCVTSVGGDAFSYSNTLITVNLPECTIVYGYEDSPQSDVGAFGSCTALVSANIPKLITAGNNAFENCNLTSIDFPFLTTAGNVCFAYYNNLTSVNLPNLIFAGNGCFLGGSSGSVLTSISLPSLTSIGDFGFYQSVALTTISLPSCTALGSDVLNNDVFFNILGNTITLTVPSALMTANAGNPDGDIVYLQANNTVTVITV